MACFRAHASIRVINEAARVLDGSRIKVTSRAAAGYMSNPLVSDRFQAIARDAVSLADALIAEIDRKPETGREGQ